MPEPECPPPLPEKLCPTQACATCPDVPAPVQCPEQVKCETQSTAAALPDARQPQVYLENGFVDKEVLIELVRKVIWPALFFSCIVAAQ
jgi:hypothetical protein